MTAHLKMTADMHAAALSSAGPHTTSKLCSAIVWLRLCATAGMASRNFSEKHPLTPPPTTSECSAIIKPPQLGAKIMWLWDIPVKSVCEAKMLVVILVICNDHNVVAPGARRSRGFSHISQVLPQRSLPLPPAPSLHGHSICPQVRGPHGRIFAEPMLRLVLLSSSIPM